MTRIVYLHGFASGPQSGKARFFGAKFRELGVEFDAPALDRGDFEGSTLTGETEVIDEAVAGRPAILMGSSLGGYLAAWYAGRHPEIERVILMAPAFHFAERWRERFSPQELDEWQRKGSRGIYHYGSGRERELGYHFLKDAETFEPEPEFPQPGLILHGTRDPVVPADSSRAYAARHANVALTLLDSAHELTDVLEPMWARVQAFLVPKPVGRES